MPLEPSVIRVERDRILELRARELIGHGKGSAVFSKDMKTTTRHWAALVDGAVVGCVSVMRLRGYALRGMAVATEYRRQGIGARLLRVVCAEVDAPMWCNARIQAVPFYVSMGWVAVGPVFELLDRGAHQRLIWTTTTASSPTRRP
jgi:GNAT superfamily N-acetyltransferase